MAFKKPPAVYCIDASKYPQDAKASSDCFPIDGKNINFQIFREIGDPYGIRTRVAAVKGRCPRPLDEGVVVGEAEIYGDAPPPSSRMNRKNSD